MQCIHGGEGINFRILDIFVLTKQRLRAGRNGWMQGEDVGMWKRQTIVRSGDEAMGEERERGGDSRRGGTEQTVLGRSPE